MGQKPSRAGGRTRSPISWWMLRGQGGTRTPNPQQPIRFQYKTKRKNSEKLRIPTEFETVKFDRSYEEPKSAKPQRAKSEPNLAHRSRERRNRSRKNSRFGYEIGNVDDFLAKATIEKPANIPVVLAIASVLYRTRSGGYQEEIRLPLGMVVNAVFKNQNWLYIQTPHAEEGYVSYSACLPLGIIPPAEDLHVPCWEKCTDIFPKPSGNMTDSEKETSEAFTSKSEGGYGSYAYRRKRSRAAWGEEKSVDRLYLQAAARGSKKGARQTLLAVREDFEGKGPEMLHVRKGDVVALVGRNAREWFWVRDKDGEEGFIPAAVAGHGFL